MTIKIILEDRSFIADLRDTPLARAFRDMLPITETGSTWGEEIYFALPAVPGDIENPQETVEAGDLAYWPPGNAFCLFWGPTPASRDSEIRPASEVEVIGSIQDDTSILKGARGGLVSIEYIED